MYDQSDKNVGNGFDELHLPRLLCLHGGGSNAKVFKSQCRVLSRQLQQNFRLCYVQAPWESEAGPDVTAVYQDYAPFRRWLRWRPWHDEIDASAATKELEHCIEIAMKEDNARGATGEWVGLLGFSQGAKMCASLLLRQQARAKLFGNNHPAVRTKYRFAIMFAGSGPLVSLDPMLLKSPALVDASEMGLPQDVRSWQKNGESRHVIRLPTVHVHGLKDPGLSRHRQFMEEYCQAGTTRMVEWDGDHRVPIKTRDVSIVVKQILDVARQTGVITEEVSDPEW